MKVYATSLKISTGGKYMESAIKNRIPLQCIGTKLDVAHSALYLASDASKWITGTIVVVDGGAWTSGSGGYILLDMYQKLLGSKL